MATEGHEVTNLPGGAQMVCDGEVCRLLPGPYLAEETQASSSETPEGEKKQEEAGGEAQGEDAHRIETTQGGNPAFVSQHVDEEQVSQLVDFGFPRLRAEKALFYVRTQPGGGGVEAAVEWLEAHAEDEDIDAPISESEQPKERVPREVWRDRSPGSSCCGGEGMGRRRRRLRGRGRTRKGRLSWVYGLPREHRWSSLRV
ncbi:pub domain-containing protein [Cystoisospora suis]|uniref:Pub domain-containing protein n=1 Tax=Cystoisospora suis TaxID=483139 RepID=A0A2C6LB07_9APIC|nr:pub domain-containing protein [Cystoisospora suis]